MAQPRAELQLLHQPVAAVRKGTVTDQHHPIPGVQRKGRGPPHQTVQHPHRQAGAVQHPGHTAPYQKARCRPRLKQPGPPGVEIHRQQIERGPGLLLGSLQPKGHIYKPGGALGRKACPQQLSCQLGGHLAVHRCRPSGAHAVAQQHLGAAARITELIQRIAADALPRRRVGRRTELRRKQRPLTESQHRDGAAVGDLGQIHIPAAEAAHLLRQARDLLPGKMGAADRNAGSQPPGKIGGHAALQRLKAQPCKQLGDPALPPGVGQTRLPQLTGQLGQRPGQCAVLLRQGGAQHLRTGAVLAAAAPQPVAVVGRRAEVRRVDAD